MIDSKHCAGCRDNYYNQPGNSVAGRCWNRDSATLVPRLQIPMDLPPPYTDVPPQTVPNCYGRRGYVFVKPEAITPEGYWKR